MWACWHQHWVRCGARQPHAELLCFGRAASGLLWLSRPSMCQWQCRERASSSSSRRQAACVCRTLLAKAASASGLCNTLSQERVGSFDTCSHSNTDMLQWGAHTAHHMIQQGNNCHTRQSPSFSMHLGSLPQHKTNSNTTLTNPLKVPNTAHIIFRGKVVIRDYGCSQHKHGRQLHYQGTRGDDLGGQCACVCVCPVFAAVTHEQHVKGSRAEQNTFMNAKSTFNLRVERGEGSSSAWDAAEVPLKHQQARKHPNPCTTAAHLCMCKDSWYGD